MIVYKGMDRCRETPRDSAVSRAIKAEGCNRFLKARGNGNSKSQKESLKEEATLTRAMTFD